MQDYREQNNQPSQEPLNKNQKIAVAVLGVFAVFIFIFWGVQFKKNIKVIPGGNNNDISQNTQNEADNSNNEQALKNKDTDKDDLLDWDELNVYKTSPYLEDSDSDGILDGVEIKNNTDPNCPQGRDCSATTVDNSNLSQNTSTLGNINSQPTASSTASSFSDGLNKILSGSVDAKTLRQLLLEQGMDKDLLGQISDEELMKNYKETLSTNK